MQTLKELNARVSDVTLLTDLDSKQLDEVQMLLEQPGIYHLLGLLLGEKQGKLVQLSNLPLHSEQHRYMAAELQGQIKALDSLRYTIIDLFQTAADERIQGDD